PKTGERRTVGLNWLHGVLWMMNREALLHSGWLLVIFPLETGIPHLGRVNTFEIIKSGDGERAVIDLDDPINEIIPQYMAGAAALHPYVLLNSRQWTETAEESVRIARQAFPKSLVTDEFPSALREQMLEEEWNHLSENQIYNLL